MALAEDLGFRRGLAAALLGIAVLVGSVAVGVVGLNFSGQTGTSYGGIALLTAIFGGILVLAGALILAFPSRPG